MTDPQHEETFADTERKLRETITTLRAQLAEAQAELSALSDPLVVDMNMLNGRIAKPSVDGIVHIYAGQITRADRAEAALAAQIEADAKTCDRIAGNTKDFNAETRRSAGMCAAAIRAQPHDRTALDRMLTKARENALRDAVRSLRRRKAVYLLKARKAMRSAGEVQDPDLQSQQWEKCDQMMHTAKAHDYAIADILALIEKQG